MRSRHVAARMLVLAVSMSLPAAGDELWRGPAGEAECRVALANEIGGVSIEVDPTAREAVVLGVAELAIEAAPGAERTELEVTRRGAGADIEAGDVELRVPPGCALTVRTGAGPVQVEIGRESPPIAVETGAGDVTARVDPSAEVTIHLATSGEITTDFTIEIDFRYHREPAKVGRVAIGSGAAEVRLDSRRGAVRVLRPTDSSRPESPSLP